ncbi:MAG: T9SS type A sorting domain-containing protein, partial [Bacteroidetes bacterium SB0662_bin_6]|nr:T9SS type A sorting domain-containing protein [Bacteroidetes bacterium SB0662_bin_6]
PEEVSLGQNYPNPFNPETAIRYALPKTGEVRLTVYDLLGHEVAMLVDGLQSAGFHTVRFDGSGLPSGPYVYRLQAGNRIFTRTMILLK